MKYSQYIRSAFSAVALILAVLLLPKLSQAQRFSHPSFGGGGGGSRPAAPPPRMEAPRQAPVQRPAPVNRPVPAAPVNRPVDRPEVRPVPDAGRTINGGGRNIGNHDFHPAPVVNITQHVDVHERVNVYHTSPYRGVHPYAYHPYHPYYWGPRWHPVGFFLPALTAGAFRFYLGNQYYYYDDGAYYTPSQGGYTSVPPPIGAVVGSLPDGFETCMVGNDTFYYYAGAFYVSTPQGYQVVDAPPGAVVSQLPVGAVDQQINGEDLLVYNNVYYQPISQDGQDAYEVVPSSN